MTGLDASERRPPADTGWQSWHAQITKRLRARDFDGACAVARAAANAVGPESRGIARVSVARCLDLAGRSKEATQHYRAGIGLVPPSWRLFMKAGICAIRSETYGLAERYLTIASMLGGQGWKVFFLKGVAESRLKKWRQALDSFRAALAHRPDDFLIKSHLAYAELMLGRAQEAFGRLLEIRDAITESPEAWLWLVQAQRRCGYQEDALKEVGLLLDRYPDFQPALLMVAELSMLQGDYKGALVAYEQSQLADGRPASSTGVAMIETNKRSAEEIEARIEYCRKALEQGPDGATGPQLAQSYAKGTPVPAIFRPRFGVGRARQLISDREALANHFRTVHALLLREVRGRFARKKLGYLWALIEPTLHVLVFYLIFSTVGRRGVEGMSLLLFLSTGVLTYGFMGNTLQTTMSAVDANKPLLAHPNVKIFDVICARVLLQFSTSFLVFLIFILAIWSGGERVRIENPIEVVYCLIMLTMAGVGLGLIVNAFTPVMRSLPTVFGQFMRIMFFSSGVFFTITDLPRKLQEYLLYNPFLHLIDIVRFNFNPRLAVAAVNLNYPTLVIATLLLIGLVSHLAMRRRILLR